MNSTDALKKLQQMLNATLVPSPRLSVDGVMGPKTRSALARYNAVKERIGEGDVGRLISANTSSDSADTAAGSPASDAWMSIAEAELGTAEVAGTARNQRIIAYHSATSLEAKSDEVPWCSSFVNWVMRQAGYTSTNSALARSWLGWGVACGPRTAPSPLSRRGARTATWRQVRAPASTSAFSSKPRGGESACSAAIRGTW